MNFTSRVLSDKPSILADDNFVNNLYENMKAQPRDTFNLVHFSDAHIELEYAASSSNVCQETVCCRAVNGFPSNQSQ